MIEILSHTPVWVLPLFIGLLALGYVQSKPRAMNRMRLLILPAVMVLYSAISVVSMFDVHVMSIGAWVFGLASAVLVGRSMGKSSTARFNPETQKYNVPGSWFPMVLILAIFLTKYVVAAATAMALPIVTQLSFMAVISVLYGCFSGAFLARARRVLAVAN